MILNDFDSAVTSTFNPEDVEKKIDNFPKVAVTCFSERLINKIVSTFGGEEISCIHSANGIIPIYRINYKGIEIALFMSRVGAPACTVAYEEVIAMGVDKLVMFGTCGVLFKEIEDLAIIIPTSAIRDEGTSYHYAEASEEITLNEKYKNVFIDILNQHSYTYTCGKTWTTDAPYRETQSKVKKRKDQGAVCVEMECASMAAVAKFRNKDFFQFLYAADNLDSVKWDTRSLGCASNLDKKEQIALLAFELAKSMNDE